MRSLTDLIIRDNSVIWHPYTQMKTAPYPIPIVAGSGCYLITEDGRQIIDAISSWWVSIHGHGNPVLAQAIAQQAIALEQVIFAGFTHEPAIRLSERLLQKLPFLSKVFFSDNGSTAVEVAIKMAVQWFHNCGENRNKIIAFWDSYHGDTFGSMSVSSPSVFTNPFSPMLFEVHFVPTPTNNNLTRCLQQVETILKSGQVAAIIAEPIIQGAGGMNIYPAENLDAVVKLCRQFGAFFIADEVMTGFCRLGTWFASDLLTEKPDLIALSKALTGGCLPMGVTLCNQTIFEGFWDDDRQKMLFHGHSFTANPIACAAANASLDLLETDYYQKNLLQIQQTHQAIVKQLEQVKGIREVRTIGTILAFRVAVPKAWQVGYLSELGMRIFQKCIAQNVLIRPLGDVVYVMPPYIISEQELNQVYSVIMQAVQTVLEEIIDEI
ncbi:MAG: adenosylmethionine--8-amino-7-oxononanoate transaminase [Bacteroidia bacterium]|nr:adenosylmethionine--8-amino-7-oxononanoate transaminase [Bacteroidia bacterium]